MNTNKARMVCITDVNGKRGEIWMLGSQSFYVVLTSQLIGVDRLRQEFAPRGRELDQLGWCVARVTEWVAEAAQTRDVTQS